MKRKNLVGAVSLVLAVAMLSVVLMGCGTNRAHSSHQYCNPDGSTTYYRHYPGYTRECTSRTIYHPCTHYYHSHY